MNEAQVPMIYGHCRVHVDSDAKVVVATSTYAGKTVRGVARCHPNDEFDIDKGIQLAVYRCNLKVADKRQARASRKVKEAKKALHEAQMFYNKMLNYRTQSVLEYLSAKDDLEEIEDRYV